MKKIGEYFGRIVVVLTCMTILISIITLYQAPTNAIAKKWYILGGDVNGDDEVTIKDVILLRRYISDSCNIVENAADFNSDGTIDVKDIELLRRYITGGYEVEGWAAGGNDFDCDERPPTLPEIEPELE